MLGEKDSTAKTNKEVTVVGEEWCLLDKLQTITLGKQTKKSRRLFKPLLYLYFIMLNSSLGQKVVTEWSSRFLSEATVCII